MTNPFAAPAAVPPHRELFGNARLIRSGFLYRVIDIESPVAARMLYSGWWFRQKIEINGINVWFRISWLTILRRAEFRLPPSVDSNESPAEIEITFGRGLQIRRFRIWINHQLAYDEVT